MGEGLTIRALTPETWDAFAALVERHERAGFAYQRPKGKNHTVMRRTIAAA